MKLSEYTYFKKSLAKVCNGGGEAKLLITVNFQEHRVGRLLEFC